MDAAGPETAAFPVPGLIPLIRRASGLTDVRAAATPPVARRNLAAAPCGGRRTNSAASTRAAARRMVTSLAPVHVPAGWPVRPIPDPERCCPPRLPGLTQREDRHCRPR